jgi:DNA repair exonuclease SbcCD nuclease subunit
MSIAIVGDLHTKEQNNSRNDDYFRTCMSKLERLLALHDYVIVLGDFFEKPSMSIEYLNQLIDFLARYKGRIFSILGNHDAYYRTLNLDKTAIGLLNNVGIINLMLDTFTLEGVSFDVASVVPKLQLPKKKSDILLGHFYIDDSRAKEESLSPEDLADYKYVFLGHEHNHHEPIFYKDTVIYRNGSLGRPDGQDYNLVRDEIIYSEIKDGVVSLKTLAVEKASDVFTSKIINKPLVKHRQDLKGLETLIANFDLKDFSSSEMSTHKVLVDIECPEASLGYLRLLHEFYGLIF